MMSRLTSGSSHFSACLSISLPFSYRSEGSFLELDEGMLPERLNSGGRDFKYQLSAEVVGTVLCVAKLTWDRDDFLQFRFVGDRLQHSTRSLAHDVIFVRHHTGVLEQHEQSEGLSFAFPQASRSKCRDNPGAPVFDLTTD